MPPGPFSSSITLLNIMKMIELEIFKYLIIDEI